MNIRGNCEYVPKVGGTAQHLVNVPQFRPISPHCLVSLTVLYELLLTFTLRMTNNGYSMGKGWTSHKKAPIVLNSG